ncbi:MAG TPA: toll/interleukin-1 receptor domain-containing protein [Anaerolineales bacterium]|nr:toll/interleukin-1 receptor domain-containing protein [Anaerolineales bacterium]
MPDEAQVHRLKAGVGDWNTWRRAHLEVRIDLRGADLSGAALPGANLADADLTRAVLATADLRKAILLRANLSETNLSGADLHGAYLKSARLPGSILAQANLTHADLRSAGLSRADLSGALLERAFLLGTSLAETRLAGARWNAAWAGDTLFINCDLSQVIGLEQVNHSGPSSLSTSTLAASRGKIPARFLRGCGLSDWEIEAARLYGPGLPPDEVDAILYRVHRLRAGQPLQVRPLFISYQHADQAFVEALELLLDQKDIRFWRDLHDGTSGRVERASDRAMGANATVLLVLSQHSVESGWPEQALKLAGGTEQPPARLKLLPVALDAAWKEHPWPEQVRAQFEGSEPIDLSDWSAAGELERKLGRLVEGLLNQG